MTTANERPTTLGALKQSGYKSVPVRDEMRRNLIGHMERGEQLFPGIVGYDDSVLPQLEKRDPGGAGHHPSGRAWPGEVAHHPRPRQSARRGYPHRRGERDQRRPVQSGVPLRHRARGRSGRRHRHRVGGTRPPVRREAGDAGHLNRRPHRRRRPYPHRRGPLPLRRAGNPLRPDPADQPRHLLDQRAPRPRRAHPGGVVQPHGGARRPDQGLPGAPAARRARRGEREPGRLHEPRPHHHAAQGPLRRPDSHPLPPGARAGDLHHGGGTQAVPGDRGPGHRGRRT